MTEVADVGAGSDARPYVAGDFLELLVTVRDAEGAVVNITEATAVRWGLFRMAPGVNPVGAVLLSKSLGSGIAITNGAGGQFTVTIANGETGAFAGTYYHEAEVIDGDGRVSTVLRGQFVIAAQGLLPVV